MVASELVDRQLSYPIAGATRPGDAVWTSAPRGWRGYERTVRIGHGQSVWASASSAVLIWGVKTRSRFTVEPGPGVGARVEPHADYWLIAGLGPLRVREPVRIVTVVNGSDRCGFAYGTLDGHPVSGEEAFVVSRTPDGTVSLTLRSLTRPAPGRRTLAFPLILVAQRWFRFRYLRALRTGR